MEAEGRNYAQFELILTLALREALIIRYSFFIIHY